MTTSTVIPEALEDLLVEMAGAINPRTSKRWTTRDLSTWLRDHHSVEASHAAVGRVVRKLRAEQTEARREIIRARLHENLGPQLQTLDDVFSKIATAFTKKRSKPLAPGQITELSEELRKLVELKLRFSGIGEKVEIDADVTSGGKPFVVYLPEEK